MVSTCSSRHERPSLDIAQSIQFQVDVQRRPVRDVTMVQRHPAHLGDLGFFEPGEVRVWQEELPVSHQ